MLPPPLSKINVTTRPIQKWTFQYLLLLFETIVHRSVNNFLYKQRVIITLIISRNEVFATLISSFIMPIPIRWFEQRIYREWFRWDIKFLFLYYLLFRWSCSEYFECDNSLWWQIYGSRQQNSIHWIMCNRMYFPSTCKLRFSIFVFCSHNNPNNEPWP